MNAITRQSLLPLIVILALLGLRSTAWAQEASSSPAAEERGLQLGALRLIPALSLRAVYDTNVTNRPDADERKDGQDDVGPTADMIIRMNLGFSLVYPSRRLGFRLGGQIGYDAYLGLGDEAEGGSSTSDLSDLNGAASIGFNIFPEGVFSVGIRDDFSYSSTALNHPLVFDIMSRLRNRAALDLRYQPGGGMGTMRFALRYANTYTSFTEDAYASLNTLVHEIQLHGEYFFLPRTAAFFVASFKVVDYFDFKPSGATQFSADAMPIRLDIGMMGQISESIALNVSLNYQYTNSANLSTYPYPGGRVEMTWQALDRTQLQLGFSRQATVVSLYGYYTSHLVYLNFKQWLVNDNLRMGVAATFDYQIFGDISDDLQAAIATAAAAAGEQPYVISADRNDMLITVAPYINYRVFRWMTIGASYRLTMRTSDGTMTRATFARAGLPDEPAYEASFDMMKHEAMLNLLFTY